MISKPLLSKSMDDIDSAWGKVYLIADCGEEKIISSDKIVAAQFAKIISFLSRKVISQRTSQTTSKNGKSRSEPPAAAANPLPPLKPSHGL